MSKVIRNGLLVLLVVALVALPAYANLVPTTFGFPVIVQNGSTSAFNQDTATATDFENINIDIPIFDHFNCDGLNNNLDLGATAITADDFTATANVLPFGPVNLAFPSISQTVNQTQTVTHTDFAQTNEFAEFAYPFVGVGPVALPGFGFGW
jgi:hypothetical protein